MKKKTRGYAAEYVAQQWLSEQGVTILETNRTIRGGELDIVGHRDDLLIVAEVRCVDAIDDLSSYMSAKKLKHLIYSIQVWIHQHNRSGSVRADVIYVKDQQVIHHFQDVTNG